MKCKRLVLLCGILLTTLLLVTCFSLITRTTPVQASIFEKIANYTITTTDALSYIDCSGTFTVTLPDSLSTGFQTTIINTGPGVITLNASILYTTDASIKLTDRYAAASALHKGSGTWFAFGNLK